jgi:S1-C subfamily serine protease
MNTTTTVPVNVDTSPIRDAGAIADAAARVEPSVVTIDTEYRPVTEFGASDFFGGSSAVQSAPRGTGSGVIISPDGIIVTNNHVVQDATKISVTLSDGKELVGRVIGSDAQSDIAVVKVDQAGLPAITLGDSDKVRVGEWVIAVGDPLRVGTTVTAGIISAIRKGPVRSGEGQTLASAIQTDAAINPGNSGGALADIEGRLIGINTSIATSNGGSIGIGFAIPVNTVRAITSQLIETGKVVRPWLGIAFGTLTDRAKTSLGMPDTVQGVIVGEVLQGSPADAAGIRRYDVIQKANATVMTKAEDLQAMVARLKVGDALSLQLWRAGSTVATTATLKERPASPVANDPSLP